VSIDGEWWHGPGQCRGSIDNCFGRCCSPRLDWLVIGGESGPSARPPHPDWFTSARDQCVAAGVPFFFKQWGEWAEVPRRADGPGRMVRAGDVVVTKGGRRASIQPRSLSCELEGEGPPMRRVGKKNAGRLLDGREWNEFPRG
jgi:protein gp37